MPLPMTEQSPLISRRRGKSSSSSQPTQRMLGYHSTATTSSEQLYDTTENNAIATALDQTSSMTKDWYLTSPYELIMLTSVILNAMAAGIIIIFSNTIMPALSTLDPNVGINVMNTINTIIVNPLFIIVFFGGLISAIPTVAMIQKKVSYNNPAALYYALASTLVYFFGQFMITVTQNVPRNNALLEVDPTSEDGINYWKEDYLKSWVAWNTARGVFAFLSAILGALSLSLM